MENISLAQVNRILYQYPKIFVAPKGFVFDYVDSRNYCLVLGYDMIPYFLYLDDETRPGDTTSARIRKRIRREMNILTPVSKETPIHLVFDRVSDVEATKSRISIYNAKLL